METIGVIPRLRLHNRLDLALQHAGIGVSEMAAELGVGRNTISNYIHGRTRPNRATLRIWAETCNVDFGWLAEEVEGPSDTGPVTLHELSELVPGPNVRLDNCVAA